MRKRNFLESRLQADYETILKEIDSIFKEYDISYCVIGGIALSQYNYYRMTEDLDILVDKKDKEKLRNISIGFMRRLSDSLKRFKLQTTQSSVDILFSGEIAGDSRGIQFTTPDKVSHSINGIPIIDLIYLIAYKISSGIYGSRLKDFGDVQELLKRHKEIKKDFLDSFRDDIKSKFIEIWEMTWQQ